MLPVVLVKKKQARERSFTGIVLYFLYAYFTLAL